MEFFADTPLPAALTALHDEQDRLDAEIAAFKAFAERVADVRPDPAPSPGTSGTRSPAHASERPPPYETIRTAYEETVLAVDHWEALYAETSVAESVAEEFSPALADCLTGQSPPPFSATVQTQLQTAITESIQTRTQTRDYLERESDRLRQLQTQLDALLDKVAPVERGAESFDQRVQRLTTGGNALEDLAHTHQEYVQSRSADADTVVTGLIYSDLEMSYPGLATLAVVRRVLDRLELRLWAGLC